MLVLRYIERELTRLEHLKMVVFNEMVIGFWKGPRNLYIVKYRGGILYPSRH